MSGLRHGNWLWPCPVQSPAFFFQLPEVLCKSQVQWNHNFPLMELLRFMDAATGKSSSPVYTIDLFLISWWGSATPYIPIFLILTPSFGVEPREIRNKPVKSASVDAASLQPPINWPGITSRSAYNWRHLTESGRREFVGEKALSAFRRCVADDKNV